MRKSMLTGTVLGVVVATTGGAIAGYNVLNQDGEYADVVSVTPVTEQIRTPREECRDEFVTQQKPIKDPKQSMQQNATQTTQQVCKIVYDVREHTIGYDVQYRVGNDEPGQVRLGYDPGPRIPMRDGFLVLG
jgi:uncharacterized protein YcfJ